MANFAVAGGAEHAFDVAPSTKASNPHAPHDDQLAYRRPLWVVPDVVPAIVPRSARRTEANWVRKYRLAAMASDLFASLVGVVLALLTRFGGEVGFGYLVFGASIPLGWIAAVWISRGYESRFFGSATEESRAILRAGIGLTAAIAIASYASKAEVARGFVVIAMPAIVALAVVLRWLQRRELTRRRDTGRCSRRVLVVGRNGQAATIARFLEQDRAQGYVVVATCVPPGDTDHPEPDESLAAEADIMAAVAEHEVDVVAVAADPELAGQAMRKLSWALEQSSVDLIVSPGIVEVAGPRISVRPVAGLSLLHLERPSVSAGPHLLKSAFDRTIALLMIVILLPVLVSVALAVRATSRGPAVFRQQRVGRGGREFSMLKFRSMSIDAEERRTGLLDANDGDGVLFKLHDDPRVTRLGRALRKFSLDELPQLINVLRGDMSIVGPRPPLPEEVADYAPDTSRRLLMKPGITGLWQVSGRSDLSWDESIRLDLRYVDNWSMTLDLLILWRTVRAVVTREGAY